MKARKYLSLLMTLMILAEVFLFTFMIPVEVQAADQDSYTASIGYNTVTQGLNQWYYKEWNGSSYADMTFSPISNCWKGSYPFTRITKNTQHPDVNDSARAWNAPKAGKVRIRGTARKSTSGGDGVNVKIMKNDTQIWPASGWQAIANNDTIGVNHDFTVTVNQNDMIYFVVNKNVNNTSDTTVWDPTISYLPADSISVTGVTLNNAPSRLTVGDTCMLTATVEPGNATLKAVHFSSSNSSFVKLTGEVYNADGTTSVTANALKSGDVIITATTVDGGKTAQFNLTVCDKTAQQVADGITSALVTRNDTLLTLPTVPDGYSIAIKNSSDTGIIGLDGAITRQDTDAAVQLVFEVTRDIDKTTGDTAGINVNVPAKAPVQAAFYVDPVNGKDTNDGASTGSAFLTIKKAQDAVRLLASNMTGDIIVYLMDGTYSLDETLVFNSQDSGTNGYYITYKAYAGAKPVISGGKEITGWQLYDANKNIYKANVDPSYNFRQLYVGGVLATRARGALPVKVAGDGNGFITTELNMVNWKNQSSIELVSDRLWTQNRALVSSIVDNGDGTAKINMLQPYFTNMCTQNSYGFFDMPTWVENAYELLDTDGEWYLDNTAHVLYYKPLAGQNLNDTKVIAPVLEKLADVKGTLDNPVKNIGFEGVTFSYATWMQPSTIGYATVQANQMENGGVNGAPPANVNIEAAHDVVFEKCKFSDLGAVGLNITYAQNNIVRGCEFYDISGSGIQVLGYVNDPNPTDLRKICDNNLITENYIHNVAEEYNAGVGIFVGYARNTSITHNELANLPYTAVSLSWGWGRANISSSNHVDYNYIHDHMQLLSDGGGVYALGPQYGSTINNNYIKNQGNVYGSLYPDQGSAGFTMNNNVVSNTPDWLCINGYGQHDININNTCTDTANYMNKPAGSNVTITNTTVVSDGNWPSAAQDIMNKAGIVALYKGIKNNADASADFSANQGENQWYYKEWNGSNYADMTYTSGSNSWEGSSADVSVTADTQNPGTNDSVRAWKAPKQGVVKITGNPKKVVSGGDGVNVKIMKNNTQIWPASGWQPIANNDTTGVNHDITVTINQNDMIYFVVNKNGNNDSDETAWDPAIEYVDSMRAPIPPMSLVTLPLNLSSDSGATSLNSAIADTGSWYMSAGTKTAGVGSLTLGAGGYSIYGGKTFGDEILDFSLNTAATGWPSITFRDQSSTADPLGKSSSSYIAVIKPDVIELHRFNNGSRTVLYGNISGFTSVFGNAVKNTFIYPNLDNQIQIGAINTDAGVRIIMKINGETVFDCIDTGNEKITSAGYFGTYQAIAPIILRNAPEVVTLNNEIADADSWYMSEGSNTAGDGSLTLDAGGYSIYGGKAYKDEIVQFNMDTAAADWYGITFRNQSSTADPMGADSSCYMAVIKPDVIELQRFNNGTKTVLYGNEPGYTSLMGDAVNNCCFTPGQDSLVQVGAMNTDAGVRLVMYVNGKKVFDCVDTGSGKITSAGYFGTYQSFAPITLKNTAGGITLPRIMLSADESVVETQLYEVNVELKNVTGSINSQDISVAYDSKLFEFVKADPDNDNTVINSVTDDGMGLVKITSTNNTAITTDSDILKLTFKAKKVSQDTPGVIKFSKASVMVSGRQAATEIPKCGVKVKVIADLTPPVISVTSPGAIAYQNVENILPEFTITDDLTGVDNSRTVLSFDGKTINQGDTILLYKLELGEHTLTVNAYDMAGNMSIQTVTFKVETSVDSLKALIDFYVKNGWIKDKGISTSLKEKLDNNSIKAFINEVEAQSGKLISTDVAEYLLRDANALLNKTLPTV